VGEPPFVVTISRQLASGGAYIGQQVAHQLGMKYVDRDILSQAAAALGAQDEHAIESLEERPPGFWSPIIRALGLGAPDAPFTPPRPPPFDEADVQQIQIQLIREIAARERAVIVGRGAPHVLHDHPSVFRVFVHAPAHVRIAEVQRSYGLDEAAARAMVQRSDRNRARFVDALIHRSWTDACLYDLTLDTSVVTVDLAIDLIVQTVRARE